MSKSTYKAPIDGWVCFHWGERFRSESSARDHFGSRPFAVPACQIKLKDLREYRRLEFRFGPLDDRNRQLYGIEK